MTTARPQPALPSFKPTIRLFGKVDELMLAEFFRQQAEAPEEGPIVLELSTSGGNADIGRRIALEVQLWQSHAGRELYFLGKSFVFSAGTTIMSAFLPANRFITTDCQVLIHERKLKKTIELNGALRACLAQANDLIAEIEAGQTLEHDGFVQLVKGTSLSVEALEARVYNKDWYLSAEEALKVGLVAGLV